MRRLWRRLTRYEQRRQRAVAAIQNTGFWCDSHWAMIAELGADPLKATINVSAGLYLLGMAAKGTQHACCTFTDDTVRGVLELSR